MTATDVSGAVESRRDRLESLADAIWEHPEVALEETGAVERLTAVLREAGFEVETGVAGMETAFVARYGEGEPVVGTMGEYDALPEMSQQRAAEREPVEEGAPGHGCGHNLYGVGSLGGALAVADAVERGDLDGTVVYFGTPAEEVGGGKVFMARDGVFDGVDALVSWHPGWYTAPAKGSCLAVDAFEFRFEGVSAHAAAAPETGRSALDAVQLLNTGVEYMREHVPEAARIHYVVTEGGGAANVVPAEASVEYLVRAPDRDRVERISDWVVDVAEGAALMTRTDLDATKTSGTYDVLPNETLGDAVAETMADLGGFDVSGEHAALAADLRETLGDVSEALTELPPERREAAAGESMFTEPVGATGEGETGAYSTDSGDVSWNVPLGRFRAATWPVGTPAHSWQAVAASGSVGKDGAVYAAKVVGNTLARLLDDPDLLAAARNEFEERTAGNEYESPLPADADPYELFDR